MKIKDGQTIQSIEEELRGKFSDLKMALHRKNEEIREKEANKTNVLSSATENMNNALSEERKKLSDNTRSLLSERSSLYGKISGFKWLTFLVSVIYIAAAVFTIYHFWSVLKEKPVMPIVTAVALGIILCVTFYKIIKRPTQKRIDTVNSDPEVRAHDAAVHKIFSNRTNTLNTYDGELSKLKEEAADIEEELESIENDLFDIEYRDTILFYGTSKGFRYQLYINGNLYDNVRGKRLVVIKLGEGFHSFKLETDEINPVDGSIMGSYTFETRQIIVDGKAAQAYAMECDGKHIRQIPKKAFEKVIGQTL